MRLVTGDLEQQIIEVLEAHHRATATQNVELLRRTFTVDAVFIGTDDTEQWRLKKYVDLLKKSQSGWDMAECEKREVFEIISAYGNVVAFVEFLTHKDYGKMRGNGVLVRGTDGKWKISIYILSFHVPNQVVVAPDNQFMKLLASS